MCDLRVDRLRAMLRELEALAVRAREHEQRMAVARLESASWSELGDRVWVVRAAGAATATREDAEASVLQGRALLQRGCTPTRTVGEVE